MIMHIVDDMVDAAVLCNTDEPVMQMSYVCYMRQGHLLKTK